MLSRNDVVVGPDGHLPLLVVLQKVTSIDQSGMIMVQNDEHSYQFARNLPSGRLPRWPAVLWRGITTISCDDGRHGGDGDSPRSSCGCSFAARRTRALRQNHRPSLSQPCALAAVDAAVPSEWLLGAPVEAQQIYQASGASRVVLRHEEEYLRALLIRPITGDIQEALALICCGPQLAIRPLWQ